jgi:hypothetical protein
MSDATASETETRYCQLIISDQKSIKKAHSIPNALFYLTYVEYYENFSVNIVFKLGEVISSNSY